jgi:hypothetical protein
LKRYTSVVVSVTTPAIQKTTAARGSGLVAVRMVATSSTSTMEIAAASEAAKYARAGFDADARACGRVVA